MLSQHHQVTAVDIVPEKVELINNRKSPIQDDYIEKYLAEKELNLTATLNAKTAYTDAEFVVIAAPTNVYSKNQSSYDGGGYIAKMDKCLMQKCCFFNNVKKSTIGSTKSKTRVHIETLSVEQR